MVAVTVLVASRVPAVGECAYEEGVLAVAGRDRAVGEAVTERDQLLAEHELAVDQELDLAGVVLVAVAVGVVDATPVRDPDSVAPFAIVCVTAPVAVAEGACGAGG